MQYFDYSGDDQKQAASELTVLNNLSDEEWRALVQHSQNLHFSAGDTLLNVGETDDGVFILVSGRVEVIAKGSFGKDKSIAEISEGSIFGELSFFDSQPRSAGIRAMTEGQALHLTRQGFDQLAAWSPSLARLLLFDMGRILAFRFRKAAASIA